MVGIVSDIFGLKHGKVLLSVLFALMPVSMLMSVRTMETPFVVLLFLWGLRVMQKQNGKWHSFLPVVLLPLVRPDAVAFSCILVFGACCLKRGVSWKHAVALGAGVILYLCCCKLATGTWLPYTLMAKKSNWDYRVITYNFTIASCASAVFASIGNYTSSGLYFFQLTKPAGWIDRVGLLMTVLWAAWMARLWWRNMRNANGAVLSCVFAGVIAVAGAYACGKMLFPWYLWPSYFLCYAMVAGAMFAWICKTFENGKRILMFSTLFAVFAVFAGRQLFAATIHGPNEHHHRAAVGKQLAGIAGPGDTCFLEPAGYIPFQARDVRIIDEVGLVSPVALRYMAEHGGKWWIELVRNERPEYLIQRDHILQGRVLWGACLTEDEMEWLTGNYTLAWRTPADPPSFRKRYPVYKFLGCLKNIPPFGYLSAYMDDYDALENYNILEYTGPNP